MGPSFVIYFFVGGDVFVCFFFLLVFCLFFLFVQEIASKKHYKSLNGTNLSSCFQSHLLNYFGSKWCVKGDWL